MALPGSGTITLNDIKAEFGATGTRGLVEFYRGGAFVPSTSANASVPTSGAISLQSFYGASATTVAISNQTCAEVVFAPADATASYQLASSGAANRISGGTTTPIAGEWLLSGASADYEVRATLSSGTAPAGSATGAYLNLGTTRTWTKALSLGPGVGGTTACTLLIEIRPAGGGAVLDSATVTITATIDP